ncbi:MULTISPECIES: HD domain-containing protein [Actinomycetes]|uniref:HD domain-containing protein n=2 Tax=Actinomycetes TaxID=1760 RepID=A0ABP6M688_9MICC|nr:HD domain-containing protein [Nesterenkonia sp. CL21]MDS2173762.1 HD domain-containing protein [Nesterenkonia sp. CL21]
MTTELGREPLRGPALVRAAAQIAAEAHRGQVDKLGADYIGHPERVAGHTEVAGAAPEVVAAAWLHDVIEDTSVTAVDLLASRMPEEVVAAVEAVSRGEGESSEDYYRRVRSDELALQVKAADLADNTDPARTSQLDPETRDRLAAKYAKARELLGL